MMRCALSTGAFLCLLPLLALGQNPSFYSTRTVARAGETLTLPLRLPEVATQDQEWILKATPPQNVKILYPPRVLVGSDVAYTRILPLAPGEIYLQLPHRERLILEVQEGSVPEKMEWMTPGEGAALTGQVDVAVEWKRPTTPTKKWLDSPPVLKIPGRPVIEPTKILTDTLPNYVRLVYSLETSNFTSGWQAIHILPNGKHTAPPLLSREVLFLNPPEDSEIQELEAESLRKQLVQRNRDNMRPLPNLKEDPDASGGKMAILNGSGQALATEVHSENGGFYQFFATTRGTLAANSLPSIGLFIEHENNNAATDTRTADTQWHRVAIGRPVYLKPGKTICSLRFLNDFRQKKENRDCFIDRISIVRVPDGAGARNEKESSLSVAFDEVFDGLAIRGPTPIHARAYFKGIDELDETPPEIRLLLNGQSVRSAHLTRVRFNLQPGEFSRGANTLQLEARYGKRIVRSASQTLFVPENAPETGKDYTEVVFGPRDPAWSQATRQHRAHHKGRKHLPILALNSSSTVALDIPSDLKGPFRVSLDAGGDPFEGNPQASVRLIEGKHSLPLSDLEISANRKHYPVGTIQTHSEKSHTLEISFTNDHYKENKGDRNLHIYEVRLTPEREEQKEAHFFAHIAYPSAGHTVWQEDVIVAEAFTPSGLKGIELLINGKPHGPPYRPAPSPGPLVIPLIATPLEPGMNRLSLRFIDRNDHESTTAELPFTVAPSRPEEPGPYHRALHILNRLAYGPEPVHLARILTSGTEKWLDGQLPHQGWSAGEQVARERAFLTHHQENSYWIARRALAECILTDHPVRARFSLWVQNHFSTWLEKAGAAEKWQEHEAFFRAGFDSFDHLLDISATSPAMLVYLDQHRSFAGKINENYAREIMELHTLSVNGRYEQEDVTKLAHVLTGWMAVEEARSTGEGGRERPHRFRFAPTLNEPSGQRVIGLSLPKADTPDEAYDRICFVLESLSRHPDTARFMSEKFASHYAAYPPSSELIRSLEVTFHRTGGNFREMIQTLIHHPDFQKSVDEPRLASPMDYSIRIARNLSQADSGSYINFLNRSGMGLFGKSTPDGYPEAPQAYADSNAMLQRWHLARDLAWPLYNQMKQSWDFDGASVAQARNLAQLTAFSINGKTLDEPSRAAVASLLDNISEEKLWLPAVCALILQLPETQNR